MTMPTAGDFDFERFPGFPRLAYTPVPDVFFDRLAPHLSEAEIRVLLYIFRHTFGWKKEADQISLNQMVDGMRRDDGSVIDEGTGMHKSSVLRGVRGLVDKRLIIAVRKSSQTHGNQPTLYSLHLAEDTPLGAQSDKGEARKATGLVGAERPPLDAQSDTQETELRNNRQEERTDLNGWRTDLQATMTPANFDRWIRPLELVERANSHAVLTAPNAGVADYVEKRLAERVAQALGVERIEVRTDERG